VPNAVLVAVVVAVAEIKIHYMITFNFKITNLDCPACIKLSTGALRKISGVSEVEIDLKTGAAKIVSDSEIAWEQIYSALQAIGKNVEKIN